ncbi:MAG: hypothetical protein IJ400_05985 [Clostridia bacterium]|nr:hypothetical protein [Clostridia bacterium]
MNIFSRFKRGMGIGGWLTNYKRFNVLPDEWRLKITIGGNNNNAYPNYTRMDIEYMREIMKPVSEFKKKHPDKILWCGEFGTIRHADIESRENWMGDVITLLKENDVPYSVWNYLSTPNDGNRFSLVDDDTRQILSQRLLKALLGEDF